MDVNLSGMTLQDFNDLFDSYMQNPVQ